MKSFNKFITENKSSKGPLYITQKKFDDAPTNPKSWKNPKSKERNSFLRLIREFNESPQGKYKDGRLLIDVLDDEKICEELEYEHWTYRMAKQTALDWIAYGRPGIGNMDAVFQLEGEQQEQVLKLALELFARNEMRIKRLTDEVNERIQKGLPPSSGAQLLEITEKDNVRNIQGRNTPRITEHDPTDW